MDGLNRYDWYELKTFRPSSDPSVSGFHYIDEDKYGFIWASSYHIGIFRFNPVLEKFEFFNYVNEEKHAGTYELTLVSSVRKDVIFRKRDFIVIF